MKHFIKWVIAIILILLISNFSWFKILTGIDNDYYRYSNANGSFTGLDYPQEHIYANKKYFDTSNHQWQIFTNNPDEAVIYRLYKKSPLKFWRWYEYLFDWRYKKIPYKDWDEIEKARGINFVRDKRLQRF